MDQLFGDLIPKQVYGEGAPESGQQATPQQQAYAAAAAKLRDPAAPAGADANPTYDTPTATASDASSHVDLEGKLHSPTPSVNFGIFNDLLPGTPVRAREDQLLGIEKGIGEPLTKMNSRIANVPMVGGFANAFRDAFPEVDALLGASKAVAPMIQSDVEAKTAAGKLPGRFGEGVGNMIDATAMPGGPLTSGALSGLLLSKKDDPMGVGIDMAEGAIGGKVAHSVLGGIANLVSPKVSPKVQTLIDAGLPLTPGQMAGATIRWGEDAGSHLPFIGPAIRDAQRRSLEGLNIAVANRALAPIGEAVPAEVAAGRDSISYAGDKLSERYNALIPSLTLQADQKLVRDMNALGQQASGLGGATNPISQLIKSSIADKVDPKTGMMAGDDLKDAETKLSLLIGRYRKSPDPDHQNVADGLEMTRQALRDWISRANPQAADELGKLNAGWANLAIGEQAASRLGAEDGVFTPSQLAGAVRASNDTVRKRGYARGTALMQDLSDAALSTLPSTVPDSGTASREALEAAIGFGVGKESGTPIGPALGLAAALRGAYSPAAQPVMQAILAGPRPAIAPKIAAILNAIRPVARGAGSTLPTLIGNP